MPINYTLSLCLVFGAFSLSAQNFNRPVPAGVPPYSFFQMDSTVTGYYLVAPFLIGNQDLATRPPVMILDNAGYLCWYNPIKARNVIDFKYHPQWQRFTFTRSNSQLDVQFMVMDQDFSLIDSFTTIHGVLPDVHDFQLTTKNTYLLAGVKDSLMDLSGYLFNGVPGSATTHVTGFVVQEFDENHQLLFEWNSNNHIHPSAAFDAYGYNPAQFDYCHGNSIEEDWDGNLILSFRHLNAIYKINKETGAVIWKFGGKNASFAFEDDPGFSGQHDVRRLPNGNIALFDNGNMAAFPKVSRAVEYHLDTLSWTASKVWEYKYEPGFFSSAMGGHETNPDRQHLISYGLIYRPYPSFVLVNDEAEIRSEAFFQDSFMSYRAGFYDLLFIEQARPVIQCSQLSGGVQLSGPVGAAGYQWSTGEQSQAIDLTSPGVYQLWVDSGVGYYGSVPFVLGDMTKGCPISAVDSPQVDVNQSVIECYDLLGRKVALPDQSHFTGKIYVVKYANGRFGLKAF